MCIRDSLKIGYWIGTTPKKQESWKFLGVFVSAATVAGVMIILNKTYGFGPGSPLEAPQANAMAAVIQPLMQGGTAPWVLYFCGAVLALVLTGIGIPVSYTHLGADIAMTGVNFAVAEAGAFAVCTNEGNADLGTRCV